MMLLRSSCVIVCAMFAYSLYGILHEWIVRDFDQPPEVMASIVRDTIASML